MIKAARFGAVACMAAVFSLVVICGCSSGGSDADTSAAAIESGWNYFSASEYSLALADFVRAEALAGDDAAALQEAKFAQGLIWHVRTRPENDPKKARAAYDAAIAINPGSDFAAWSALWKARIASEVEAGEYPPAEGRLAAYQEVVDKYAGHPAGEEAFLCVEAIKLEDDTPETAIKVRDEIIAFLADPAHENSGWRQTAYGILGNCDDILDDLDGAYEHTLKWWESRYVNPKDPKADPALIDWTLALAAEFDIGDFEAARRHYNAFIERYPTHQRVFLAKLELERLDKLERELLAEPDSAKAATEETK